MKFPFELGDPRVHQFAAFWESQRTASNIPIWNPVEVNRAIPDLVPNIVLLDVCDPPAIIVRQAGTAYRDHFGIDVTGTDMLGGHTQPEFRQARFHRFNGVVSQPCGAIAVASMIGAYGISVLSDSVWLPFRLSHSDEMMIVVFHSLGGHKEYDESTPVIVPVTDKFSFMDIGFGVPRGFDRPGFWSKLKTPIMRWFS